MDATLLLNADGTPLSLLPLSSIGWQDALKFLWPGEAEPLHLYEDWYVRSPSVAVQVPAVLILRQQVPVRRAQYIGEYPAAEMVFLRDNYTCQYCRKEFPRNALTLDHVLPRKFGGKSHWNNLTSACEPCNGKRGHDVRIQPATKPFRPTYHQLINNLKRRPLMVGHPSWNFYLGWPPENIRLCDPRKRESDAREF